jgi:hypothetical protein
MIITLVITTAINIFPIDSSNGSKWWVNPWAFVPVKPSAKPGFGGWFDDPMIRMIQVEHLKLQPCPTLFSVRFAPSVSHLGDESHNFCQLLASDPSLCSIFDAENLLPSVWSNQHTQQMTWEICNRLPNG